MKLIGSAIAVSLVGAACTLAACSGQHSSTGTGAGGEGNGSPSGIVGGNSGQGNTGTVGANLDIAPGVSLRAVPWTITNGTNTYNGVANVGDAQSVEWVAGGILAGSGYTVSVNTQDTNGDNCTGTSSPFTVSAGGVTQVVLAITCTVPTDAALAADVNMGVVEVDASVNLVNQGAIVCPGITSLSANPAELAIGQSSQLGVSFTDSPVITWSVTGVSPAGAGGTFSPSASSANPTFTCNTPGSQVSVTVTLAPQPDAGGQANAQALCANKAFTTMSILINCEGTAPRCVTPTTDCTPDAGTATCVNLTNDPNNCGQCGIKCASGQVCTGGVCGALPPSGPCTQAGQTNCVSCNGSTGGICTVDEALWVQKDITHGIATVAGPDTAAGHDGASGNLNCYQCMLAGSCIDSPSHHVTGVECGDLTGNFTNGSGASVPAISTCQATLTCDVAASSNGCATNANGESFCYCGTGGFVPDAIACESHGSAVNGACLSQQVAGFAFVQTDATDIVTNFTDTTEPSGKANFEVGCALSNNCTSCLVP